jgi:hypothetical protein
MFNLKEPDIQAMKLNDKIRIDNSWWNINKVIDYDANAHKLTKVELISIDSEVNFTPFMGPSGPNIPTPPAGIGPIQIMAMNNVNATKMMNTNVFSNQATATVQGRGNVIVGGTRSVVVGDNNIVGADQIITSTLTVAAINGEAASTVLLPPFVQTDATDVTLWNYGQGGVTSNTTYGEFALRSNTTGLSNTAIGVSALENNTTGLANTAIGTSALENNTIGFNNTAIGSAALTNNTTSNQNTAIGAAALLFNTTGNDNTAIGMFALTSNNTGSNNTAIGSSTDSGNFDASIILGRDAVATASNQFVSGSVTYPAGAVNAAVVAQTQTWDVIINGVAHKILLA